MTQPIVDVTIAVHAATRPIERAVASVLEHTQAHVRVTVVAHNIDPEIIRARLGSAADSPQLRLVSYVDNIPSPAGPMNYGFSLSDAPFVCLMGSDDTLAPGAIDSWLRTQRTHNAEIVLARIQLASGSPDPYPPVRFGRTVSALHPVKDRLAYRSAPLGLISRARFGELRLSEGLRSGEDLCYSLTAFFTAQRIAYDLHGPSYICHADAGDRVTSDIRPLADDWAFLDELETLPWFAAAPPATREAICVKLMRMHFFDSLTVLCRSAALSNTNRDGLLRIAERLFALAPRTQQLLSRADTAVLTALGAEGVSAEHLSALLMRRSNYRSAQALMPTRAQLLFHRQAPLRTLAAGLLSTRV